MAGFFLPLLAAAAAASPADGLGVFDRLSGRCWEGKVSESALDVHCFEQIYGGAHVRDRHRVLIDGKPVYEGETIYSREAGRLMFIYLNSQGGVGHGEAKADARGICFTGEMRGEPEAAPQDIASCWHWRPDGGYSVSSGAADPVRFTLSDKRF